MAVTWSNITAWTRSGIDAASDELAAIRRSLVAESITAQDALVALRRWESSGAAVDALESVLTTLDDDLDRLVNEVSELMMAAAEASNGIWDVMTLIDECESLTAVHPYLSIDTAGAVHCKQVMATSMDPAASNGPTQTSLENARRRLHRAELEALVASALTRADEVDAAFKVRLDAVANGTYVFSERSQHSPGLPDSLDPSWSATEVATWWGSLTEAERRAEIAAHPQAIGNTDGIDAASRDQANRLYLPIAQQRLKESLAAIQKKYDDWERGYSSVKEYGPNPYEDDLRIAKAKVADIEAIASSAAAHPNHSLLVVDTGGSDHVRAAMGIGDVDTADHVATFVPGMSTSPAGSLDGYLASMENLRDHAIRNRNGSVAAIAWLGYDAPAGLGEAGWTEVASTARARAGAQQLAAFTEGIQASRLEAGSDPHQTVLGHSYGSTTSGFAVAGVNAATVDDLIMFGSPGSAVHNINEYNLDSGTAYVSAVDSEDWVQGIGPDSSFGVNPAKLPGITHLTGDAVDPDGWSPIGRHSSYLDKDSATMEEFADIITNTPVNQ